MKYDPIMCMMVDDSVKTKDRDPYAYEEIKKDIQMMKSGKASYITKNELIGRISHSFNNRTPQSGGITKEQKTELMNLVMSSKDERTLDKAIEVVSYNEKYDKFRLAIAIREKITEENDAINSYLSLVSHIDDYEIVNVIKDIANEEKVHVGELQKILYELDPDELTKEKEGRKENAL